MVRFTDMTTSARWVRYGIICGTQMAKTTNLLNVLLRKLDDDPQPCLYIGPTKNNVTTVIEPQIESAIESCDSLVRKRPPGRRRTTDKRIAGVSFRLAWAGSETEIAAQNAAYIVVDEFDKMDPIPGHGDVLVQADARRGTFADGRTFVTSTPTEGTVETEKNELTGIVHFAVQKDATALQSRVWRFFQGGTRFEWAVPCPHCRTYFVPRFPTLVYPEGATPALARREAKIACIHCGTLIDEAHKFWMNAHGYYLAPGMNVEGGLICEECPEEEHEAKLWREMHASCGTQGLVTGEIPDSDDCTCWVSGLMSPWRSFGACAAAWVDAARSHDGETIRGVLNTVFGELYRTHGDAPEWTKLRDIARDALYRHDELPVNVQLIFVTVDVQKDRLVVVVRGWGYEWESWLLHHEELWGDTDQGGVWERLSALVDKPYGDVGIAAVAVDSGYRDERVYEWVSNYAGKAYATKGVYNPRKLYSKNNVEVSIAGKSLRTGLHQWTVDTGYMKGWVHDRIGRPQQEPGAWHLYKEMETADDYCKQLINEHRMKLPSGRTLWRKVGPNDFLDAEALQVFLAHVEGVRSLLPPDQGGEGDDLAALAAKMNG